MLILQNGSYMHSTGNVLFDNISLTINKHDKTGIIGNNGAGKSTLLQLIAGELQLSEGMLLRQSRPYYVPQIFGQYNHLTIAQALHVEDKLQALKEILEGAVTENNLNILGDDWTLEERCMEALREWKLTDLDLNQKMETLSGGQKTKVFLAGISLHSPECVLLDEPSNHLDVSARQVLYHFIETTSSTLVIVSHDRNLLNLLDTICELSQHKMEVYGGNYDFYLEQKQIETNAFHQELLSKEKALRKAREKERETAERQQKLDARGKKKQEKAGVARIMMNTLRNNAENSTSKLKGVHAEKIGSISQELQHMRSALPDTDKMKVDFNQALVHKGKRLFSATKINYAYHNKQVWKEPLDIQITSGERIALKGPNGSGKTTFINIVAGKAEPQTGSVYRADNTCICIDQDYSLIDNQFSVYEQTQQFNTNALQEHELKIRLNRFLFTKDDWEKKCGVLSGGEKMRLLLCCLTISNQSPDIIILDEPTNNLDLQNIAILTAAMNEYQGTLIVVSHDEYFLKEIGIDREIEFV